MRKFLVLVAMVVTTGLALVSCGGSKNVASSLPATNPMGVEVAMSKAQQVAMQDKATRAVGNAQHFREQAAINTAELQARAQLARKVAEAIISVGEDTFGGTSVYAGDDATGRSVNDQDEVVVSRVAGKAKEIVKNTDILEISRYKLPNNQWNVYVCVGYRGGKSAMAEAVAKGVEDLIPEQKKQEVKQNHKAMIDRINAEFDKEMGL